MMNKTDQDLVNKFKKAEELFAKKKSMNRF